MIIINNSTKNKVKKIHSASAIADTLPIFYSTQQRNIRNATHTVHYVVKIFLEGIHHYDMTSCVGDGCCSTEVTL